MSRALGGLLAIHALALLACSSTHAVSIDDGGADASADGPGAGGYTLDDVCTLVPPKVCALRKGCCAKSLGFDEQACEDFERSKCASDVAEVSAGTMTFDGSRIDGCLARIAPYFDICYLTFDDFVRFTADDVACSAFAGKLAAGASCGRKEQCTPSTSSATSTSCDRATKVCKNTDFLPLGTSCDFGPGISQFCTTGLYCEFSADAGAGTCQPATARGSSCSTVDPYGLECGVGSRCDHTTATCQPSLPGGSPCTTAFDCASLSCLADQTCAPQAPAFHADECGVTVDGG